MTHNILYVAVMWQNQKCRLTLHYENGFTLTSGQPSDDANKLHIYWHYPYEKLRSSADDGSQLLWLDFGDDGEHVRFLFLCIDIDLLTLLEAFCNL